MEDFYETSYVKTGRDGRRPRLCVTYHDDRGGRHERTRAADPKRMSALRREAEEWRAELNDEWRERLAEEEERRRREEIESRIPKLSDYMRRYVADRAAEGLERSTVRGYNARMNLVLDPDGGLPDLRLDQIDVEACRAWMRHLVSERCLGKATISTALNFLRSVLNRAVEDRLIPNNPARRVKPPRRSRETPNALDRISVAKLVSWIEDGDGDWFRTCVAIGLYTGMRQGEICALQWKHVDLEGGEIHLRQAIGYGDGGEYLKGPKNGKFRDIGMPSVLVRAVRKRFDEVHADLVNLYDEDEAALRMPNLYVCGRVDGTWQQLQTVRNHWNGLRKRLGLRGFQRDRCPFHDLRHTYITYLLNSGVPVTKVMSLVGHSSAAMTLDVYASVDPEMVRQVALSVDEVYDRVCAGEFESKPVYELPAGDE